MRRAQERMRAARPYAEKIRAVAAHLSSASSEYKHAFLVKRETIKKVGVILITSDKGLCGGLNSNLLRLVVSQMKNWDSEGKVIAVCAIGNKGLGFMNRFGAEVKSHLTGLGDAPHQASLIGAVKIMLDAYVTGELDAIHICYNHFVNTMKQEPCIEQLLPLSGEQMGDSQVSWDYIYEPDAKVVVDDLLTRYVESLVYQGVVENMASEQSSRMVAMKSASDNAKSVIADLKLVYNKARQAAITREISEICSGAAAVG
jgi:F-type H+-transporting ATPase subunit gamma